jgi:hypothetical protein
MQSLGVSKLMVPLHATVQSSEMLLLNDGYLGSVSIGLMY